jgi:hypothetical protein
MEIFSLGLISTVLIRPQNFLTIFFLQVSLMTAEKNLYVYMRINTSYVLVSEPADAR